MHAICDAFRQCYIRELWQRLGRELTPIAIFGAGAHTEWLLDITEDVDGPEVRYIIDDAASDHQQLCGLPVRRGDAVDRRAVAAVVVSSDSHEATIARRAQELFADTPIVRPYEGLPPGPYPKVGNGNGEATVHDDRRQPVQRRQPLITRLEFPTVRQYNRYLEQYPELCFLSGDTKNVERGWVADVILNTLPRGSRLLEIGGDECLFANQMQERGYEVWNVDPFEAYGGGTGNYEQLCEQFPELQLVRGFVKDVELPTAYFDCVYSISVLEHVPRTELSDNLGRAFAALKPDGISVQAVDYCMEGPDGLLENHDLVQDVVRWHGMDADVRRLSATAMQDLETFKLSPTAHYKWRRFRGDDYSAYPFRAVSALCLAAPHPNGG